MIVAGIDIFGGSAHIVILSGTRVAHTQIVTAEKKVLLAAYPANSTTIKTIAGALNALIFQHSVSDIAFKKYPVGGNFTSGQALHWQGAFASCLTGTPHYIASQTVKATQKRSGALKHYPALKYLHGAYDLAFEILP